MNLRFFRDGIFLSFVILLLGCGSLSGQSGSGFRHYGMEEGLPSVRVYRMIQDHEGFLWLATDAGVSRFDGKRFENFTTEDGLGDNDIISLVEDYWGRIWFLSYNGRLSYYKKGLFHNQQTDKWLSGVQNRSLLLTSFEDKSHNLWLGTSNQGVIKIWGDSIRHYQSDNDSLPLAASIIFQESNGDIVLGCGFCKETRMIDKGVVLDVISNQLGIDGLVWTSRGQVFGNSWITFGDRAIGIASYSKVKVLARFDFDLLVNRTDWDGEDSIWVHTSQEGSYLIKNSGKGWGIEKQILRGENTSSSLVDRNGNLWVSTLTNGIFCENDFRRVDLYGDQFGKVTQIVRSEDGQVFISGVNGLFEGDISALWSGRKYFQMLTGEIREFKVEPPKKVLATKNNVVLSVAPNKLDTIVSFYRYGNIKTIKEVIVVSKEKYWVVTGSGIFEFVDGVGKLKWSPKDWKGVICLTALFNDENDFHIGTNIGLFHQTSDSLYYFGAENVGLSGQIKQIKRDSSGRLWVLTQGNGLYILENDKIVRKYSESNGLAGDFVNSARFVDEGNALISTNLGVSIIDFRNDLITSITEEEGIRNRQTFDALLFSDTLLVATSKGVCLLVNNGKQSNATQIIASFTKVEVNSVKHALDSIIYLRADQNNISLSFSFVSLKAGKNVVGEFRNANDINWRPLSSNQIDLIGLSPGEYEISIRGYLKGTSQFSNTATLTFIISPPFWRTWWFLILEILIGLSLIAFFVRIYLKSRARRENVARRLTQSRLTALRSQMNPHFIFNSLSSIQNFVARNDHQEAFLYLARFGKLMRRVLDNSEHDMIPLEEEVETLELYLQLEQLRANNGFDFEISIAEDLEPDFHEVPPTLIQPMLENAIWHGVMHRETKGRIEVEFKLEKDEVVVCRVRDNGVGRAAARRLESAYKKDHKSKGLSITQERLLLLNDGRKNRMALEIIDLTHPDGSAAGTEVVLRVPND